jgi:hypothetical protein
MAARSLWGPLSTLPAGGAQRAPAAGTGAAGGLRCGGGVVGVSTQGKSTSHLRFGARIRLPGISEV